MIFTVFRLFACLVMLTASALAVAQTSKSVLLEELTWPELQESVRAGATTILIPVGGTEQNGPAMVLGKHNLRAKLLAEKIAVTLGKTIVAPVLAYVPEGHLTPPTEHMRFPGTITIPSETFQKTLEYAARSFKLHGFRDIVLLGDHGGYKSDMKAVADKLNREWSATPVRVHAIEEYYRVTQTEYIQQLKARGYRTDEIGTHAGLADTALMLALEPRMVRSERLRSGAKLMASEGVYGDPRRATQEVGQLGVDAIVAHTVTAIKQATMRQQK